MTCPLCPNPLALIVLAATAVWLPNDDKGPCHQGDPRWRTAL